MCLTSCGGFFEEEEAGNGISHIEDELLSDGRTKITIYFIDEDMEPKVFYLPQGVAGDGIKSIEHSVDESDHSTQISINFTSDKIKPVTLSIPHGVSVHNIISAYDDEKQAPYLLVQYNDGTTSDKFYLPKGDTGNGIKDYDYTVHPDKSITLEFLFDDDTKMTVPIPAPQDGEDGIDGEDGVGIVSITPVEDGTILYLNIEYTDGSTFPVPLERPNKWYQGGQDPNNILKEDGTSIGHDGDYFFDKDHIVIYAKDQGTWHEIISFTTLDQTYTVRFHLELDKDAYMTGGAASIYTVNKGTYFCDSANGNNPIPIPYLPGYVFQGWSTKSTFDPRTMTYFNDLTPIFGDLDLYPIWKPETPAAN